MAQERLFDAVPYSAPGYRIPRSFVSTRTRSKLSAAWTDGRKKTQRERNRIDLTGQRFGRLVAVRDTGETRKGGFVWECLCDCGNTKNTTAAALRCGETKSCGCLKKDVISAPREYRRKRPYEHTFNSLAKSSRRRGIVCSITYEEFLEFVDQTSCFYCGAEVVWSAVSGKSGGAYNLDRKDNSRGYESGNIAVCCNECNRGKGARYTFEEWVAMTRALRAVRGA